MPFILVHLSRRGISPGDTPVFLVEPKKLKTPSPLGEVGFAVIGLL